METIMMTAALLAASLKEAVARDVIRLQKERGVAPKLVAFLIGKDPVSRTYVDLKQKDCAEVGIISEVRDLELRRLFCFRCDKRPKGS